MSKATLRQLYEQHEGKLSDKWSIYLTEYDRLFSEYRESQVRLLEIGIQNGGSLEIWSKYFSQARNIVGCDINQDCAKLIYNDLRIAVVVGDANSDESERAITSISPQFDLIIDDGSHVSGDIIRAFVRYFPRLVDGGLFIAEDLHCSYWKDFQGGLFNPVSSIAFFKRLADILSYEHWGVPAARKYILESFSKKYNFHIDEEVLSHIHSVEFINSLCVIRKNTPTSNVLGIRFISGNDEAVVSGHKYLHLTQAREVDECENQWSNCEQLPEDEFESNRAELSYLRLLPKKLVSFNKISIKRYNKITNLNQLMSERDDKIFVQNQSILERDYQISILNELVDGHRMEIDALRNSTSWLLTKPIRFIGYQIARLKKSKRNQLTVSEANFENPEVNADNSENMTPLERNFDTGQDAAFEALSGLQSDKEVGIFLRDQSKLIAFYLPQYHRVSENSRWWGPGFTEWTNVVKGKANFEGHYQPHLPRELGFYDLSNIDVIREQAEMAKLYGINGFCFYYYWFSGQRILETPIDIFFASDIEIDYCLCWANENWTRTWDGDAKSVLMHQKYEDADPLNFITSLIPYFNDSRYIRVEGKPMLVVYRAKDIPNTESVFALWRNEVIEAGFDGLHITVVDFYDISTPKEVGADALVEFPPHKFNGPQSKPDEIPSFTNKNFRGGVVDYAKMMAQSAARPHPDFNLYRGIIPSWDNTARRQDTSTIIHGASPDLFQEWLSYLRAYNREYFSDREDNFIFINAWNEWGEGCHLEPDQKWGLGYLEAVAKSTNFKKSDTNLTIARNNLLCHAVKSIAGIDINQKISQKTADKTLDRLTNIQPVGGFVQKIAFNLRGYPIIYGCGKSIYRLYSKVCGY